MQKQKPHPYDAMREKAKHGVFDTPQLVRLRGGIPLEGEWRGTPLTHYITRALGFHPNRFTRVWYHWAPIDTSLLPTLSMSVCIPSVESEEIEAMAQVFMDIFNATRVD